MLTIEELQAIPLFSTVAPIELQRLAKAAADVYLGTREFAVHEGGESALFAVLTGKIEVVKLIDGVERTLGWRVPGTIFGEVPITLGTPFPGGYRAAEPSRVMRLDTRQYYALAAASPEVAMKIGALARERIGGLQSIAAEPPKPRVVRTVVIEREAPGGQAGTSSRIENYLGFPNGVSGDELARRALQQARRLGAEILVTRSTTSIDPATREVFLDDGAVLRARTVILATGVTWRHLAIDGLDRLVGKGVYYGAARSEAAVTHGLDIHLIGSGNSAGQAALHFANHARTVTLVARGDSLEKSMSRYLIEQLRSKSNIAVKLRSEVQAVYGEVSLKAIDIRDRQSQAVYRQDCGGLFVFIGADAETSWLPADIARDARGYILTGEDVVKSKRWSQSRDPYLLETSVPGIFACGDVRLSPVKRVASAVGEGSMAIAFVQQYLQHDADAAS